MTERKRTERKRTEQSRSPTVFTSTLDLAIATALCGATAVCLIAVAVVPARTTASTASIAVTTDAMQAESQPGGGARQTLIVSPHAPATSVYRDGYSVTPAPTLVWPLEGELATGDPFGIRIRPCEHCSSRHEGVDFPANTGTAVRAIAEGRVQFADPEGSTPLGVFATIGHQIDGHTVSSTYGHLLSGSLELSVGDRVAVAQVIGRVGNTGMSTGPHLHFEIRTSAFGAVDPIDWMTLMLT